MLSIKFTSLLILFGQILVNKSQKADYWTYSINDEISGPSKWGDFIRQWEICSKGKRQSPINIDTSKLLYDPNLTPLILLTNESSISGVLKNTEKVIQFVVSNKSEKNTFLIGGGPLAYNYALDHFNIHFGMKNDYGSEHTIDNYQFSGEIQFVTYNRDLYDNFSNALASPNGIAIVSIFLRVDLEFSSDELDTLIKSAEYIPCKGNSTNMINFNLNRLFPSTYHYVTYDGSMTQPGCEESVVWIVLNEPISITERQLTQLRRPSNDFYDCQKLLENNFRPLQTSYARTIRTNIKMNTREEEESCYGPQQQQQQQQQQSFSSKDYKLNEKYLKFNANFFSF